MSKLLPEKENKMQKVSKLLFFASIVFIILVVRNLQPTYHRQSRIQTHSSLQPNSPNGTCSSKALKEHLAPALQGGILHFHLAIPIMERAIQCFLSRTSWAAANTTPLVHSYPTWQAVGQGKAWKPPAREGKALFKAASYPKTGVKK